MVLIPSHSQAYPLCKNNMHDKGWLLTCQILSPPCQNHLSNRQIDRTLDAQLTVSSSMP